eukprot:285309-Rhodomonas_salina.1
MSGTDLRHYDQIAKIGGGAAGGKNFMKQGEKEHILFLMGKERKKGKRERVEVGKNINININININGDGGGDGDDDGDGDGDGGGGGDDDVNDDDDDDDGDNDDDDDDDDDDDGDTRVVYGTTHHGLCSYAFRSRLLGHGPETHARINGKTAHAQYSLYQARGGFVFDSAVPALGTGIRYGATARPTTH